VLAGFGILPGVGRAHEKHAEETAPVRILFLGPLVVVTGTQQIAPTGRTAQFIALLVAHRGAAVEEHRFIDELWNGSPPATARSAFRTYLSDARKLLGKSSIVIANRSYRLNTELVQIDLDWFYAPTPVSWTSNPDARQIERPDQPVASALSQVESALRLWRGEPAVGLHETLALILEVQRATEQHSTLRETRARLLIESERFTDAIAELRELVLQDPIREQRTVMLMKALVYGGRPTEAIRAYQWLYDYLAEEIGAQPGSEAADLERDILLGTFPAIPPMKSLAPGSGVSPESVLVFRPPPTEWAIAAERYVVRPALHTQIDWDRARFVVIEAPHSAGLTALASHLAHAPVDGAHVVWARGSEGGLVEHQLHPTAEPLPELLARTKALTDRVCIVLDDADRLAAGDLDAFSSELRQREDIRVRCFTHRPLRSAAFANWFRRVVHVPNWTPSELRALSENVEPEDGLLFRWLAWVSGGRIGVARVVLDEARTVDRLSAWTDTAVVSTDVHRYLLAELADEDCVSLSDIGGAIHSDRLSATAHELLIAEGILEERFGQLHWHDHLFRRVLHAARGVTIDRQTRRDLLESEQIVDPFWVREHVAALLHRAVHTDPDTYGILSVGARADDAVGDRERARLRRLIAYDVIRPTDADAAIGEATGPEPVGLSLRSDDDMLAILESAANHSAAIGRDDLQAVVIAQRLSRIALDPTETHQATRDSAWLIQHASELDGVVRLEVDRALALRHLASADASSESTAWNLLTDARRLDRVDIEADALGLVAHAALGAGNRATWNEIAVLEQSLVERSRRPIDLWARDAVRATRFALLGDWTRAEASSDAAYVVGREYSLPDAQLARDALQLQRVWEDRLLGRPTTYEAKGQDGPFNTLGRLVTNSFNDANDLNFDELGAFVNFACTVDNAFVSRPVFMLLVQTVANLNATAFVTELSARIDSFSSPMVTVGLPPVACFGPTDRYRALLADRRGDHNAAIEYAASALDVAERFKARMWALICRRLVKSLESGQPPNDIPAQRFARR
jgi:DNA-binding SARP family transcriptional activator